MSQTVITLDTTIGGASTNSFLSLADLDALIHQRPFHADWDAITVDDEKKAAVVLATRILSSYKWLGYIASQTQNQAFPRTGLYDNDDREYSSLSYPEWLTVACSELAFFFATEDRLSDSGTEGFSSIKIASIAVSIDKYDRPFTAPDAVVDLFKKWLDRESMFNAKVVRR